QPDQFRRRLVVRKMAAGFEDLAEPRVHALERVRRVDHATNLRRKGKEGNDARPRTAPRGDDRRKSLPPFAALETIERRLRHVRAGRGVDLAQRGGERLALFPVRKIETLTQ